MKIFVWGYIEQLLCGRLNNVESQNTFESCRYHQYYWAIYEDNSRHCLFHIWTRWSWSEETSCERKVCTQFPGPGIAKTILLEKIKIVRLMFGLLKVPSNVYRLMRTWRLGQNLKCQGPISFSRPDIFLKVWWEKWNMEIRRRNPRSGKCKRYGRRWHPALLGREEEVGYHLAKIYSIESLKQSVVKCGGDHWWFIYSNELFWVIN